MTDGDLRRHMGPNLLAMPVDEVMTEGATAVRPDMLLAEALEILESRKITALVVMEGRKPVGLLRVLDLLQAGVA